MAAPSMHTLAVLRKSFRERVAECRDLVASSVDDPASRRALLLALTAAVTSAAIPPAIAAGAQRTVALGINL